MTRGQDQVGNEDTADRKIGFIEQALIKSANKKGQKDGSGVAATY